MTASARPSELATYDVESIRSDFPIFDRQINGKPIHFLDSGASSQKPRKVLDAMDDFARTKYANVHRGAYTLSLESTMAYEECRVAVARFIGCDDPNEIVLTRGATTALNQVAFGWGAEHLQPGDKILLTTFEHHANLVPWQMVAKRTGAVLDFVPYTSDFLFDTEAFHHKLDSKVKVVAVTGMSNVLGTLPPSNQPTRSVRSSSSTAPNWSPTSALMYAASVPTSSPSQLTRCSGPPESVFCGERWTASRRWNRRRAEAK